MRATLAEGIAYAAKAHEYLEAAEDALARANHVATVGNAVHATIAAAVVWNRGRSLSDGKWRTLDSRSIFKATTTLSELHHGVLADLLTDALGVGWEARGRRHSTKPRYEIAGVPETLMAEFSERAGQIAEHNQRLRAEFFAAHGRAATAVEDMRLVQQATLATRPGKTHRSLADLTEGWRTRDVIDHPSIP